MTVKISGLDINLFKVPSDGECFGDFSFLNLSIRINNKLEKGALVETVFHELLHAVWALGQLKTKKEKEERAVSVTSSYLTGIFRDNPHLLNFIKDNLYEK